MAWSWIEIAATGFGLASVGLTVRQNIWCWPTGLVMVALYIVVFWEAKLYSDMGLQVIYVFLQLYGWYHWLHGGNHPEQQLPVARIRPRKGLAWAVAGAAGTVGLGYTMSTYTDAALPFPDAATTVLSLIAQWLMARKILESWWVWITVDVMAIGIYFYKELYPTTILYGVFLALATAGYLAWRKSYRAETSQEAMS
jgi:nicotinamide mononucleotide transporter